MAKRRIKARIRIEKNYFENDSRNHVLVEIKNSNGEYDLDTAYPITDGMISSQIFELISRYNDLGIDIQWDI